MITVLTVAEPTQVPRLLSGGYAEAKVVQVKVHSTSCSVGRSGFQSVLTLPWLVVWQVTSFAEASATPHLKKAILGGVSQRSSPCW